MTGRIVLHIILAYLLGSFPSAYAIARWVKGTDIRCIGDGNVGARNTARHISPLAGICVALLDIAKGSIAVFLARSARLPRLWVLVVGIVAVLGHDYSVLLGFRGGQGMATTVGVLLVVLPAHTAIGVTVGLSLWILLHVPWEISGVIGLGAIPLLAWITDQPVEIALYPVILLPTIGIRKLVRSHTRGCAPTRSEQKPPPATTRR